MSTHESTVPIVLDPSLPVYTCHDCGAREGELHNYFPICDQERCPLCLGQLLSCKHAHRPEIVEKAGRVPFLHFPLLCARCGAVDPDFFHVSNRQWRTVVPKPYWDLILCRACFDHIARLQLDGGTLQLHLPKCRPRAVDTATIPLPLPKP